MTEMTLKLNHPWSIYYCEPISSYTKYDTYYKELERLLVHIENLSNRIKELGETDAQLTNFIIGTPMEDALQKKHCGKNYIYQWQQLFPYHITNFINHNMSLDKDISVNIIIISPDDIFMDENYREPLFMTECEDYEFIKFGNRDYVYIEKKLKIKIDIFTCPFPQLEKDKFVIEKSNELIKKVGNYQIENFAPSEDDKKFISNFYDYLEMIASNPLSNMIINSYAIFRNVREYDNYGLFSSLLELADKYKIIATEWTFSENNYFNKIVSKINFTVDYIKYFVSYINPEYSGYRIDKYQDISREEIKKRSSEIIMGKLVLCILIDFPYGNLLLKKIKYI
jgi:hypothetical protein